MTINNVNILFIIMNYSILATDMAEHFEMTKTVNVRLKKGIFNPEIEADQLLLMKALIHSSDISNPLYEFHLAKKWSDLVVMEFNNQARLEKENNLPLSAMFDTEIDTPAHGRMNINFIDFVIVPLWEGLVSFLPELKPVLRQMYLNRIEWQKMLDAGKYINNI